MQARSRANLSSRPESGPAPAHHGEAERWLAPPFRILVASKRTAAAQAGVMQRFHETSNIAAQLATSLTECTNTYPHPYDVILVDLSDLDLEPLSWALQVRAALGQPELVFMTYDSSDPVSSGLQELGLEYVVPADDAARWVAEHAPSLATMARSKRAFNDAKERVTHAAERLHGTASDTPPTFGLFEAEQRFRETYVRALLGRASSRQEAASLARLSYRTLCHILSKLGLSAAHPLSD